MKTEIKYESTDYGIVNWNELPEETQGLIKERLSWIGRDKVVEEQVQKLNEHFKELGYPEDDIKPVIEAGIKIQNSERGMFLHTTVYAIVSTQHGRKSTYVNSWDDTLVGPEMRKEVNDLGVRIIEGINTALATRKAKADAEELVRLRSENEDLRKRLGELQPVDKEEEKEKED